MIVGLKLSTTGTKVTTVRKKMKSGSELVQMETDVATHTCKLLLRKKPEHWDINILFYISAK